jgi:TRAP-type mannitol/chloroaromatic compound transport system permease large subunit
MTVGADLNLNEVLQSSVDVTMTVGAGLNCASCSRIMKNKFFLILQFSSFGRASEMAEGELNVDSVITRLLDGKNQLFINSDRLVFCLTFYLSFKLEEGPAKVFN